MVFGWGPKIEAAVYNSNTNTYEVFRNFEADPSYSSVLFHDYLAAQKSKNMLKLTIPYAFCDQDWNGGYEHRDDWYMEANLVEDKENQQFLNFEKSFEKSIGYSYSTGSYEDRISEKEMKEINPSLIARGDLKEINIYDYIDKLHKIKITFTKDDSNEYHFESFEIID
mgnify:CR=1 FL=1